MGSFLSHLGIQFLGIPRKRILSVGFYIEVTPIYGNYHFQGSPEILSHERFSRPWTLRFARFSAEPGGRAPTSLCVM